MQETARQRGLKFPYVVDEGSEIALAFGATHTPEVFLFDGGAKLVYRGGVDDNMEDPDQVVEHYLRDALDAVVVRQQIPVTATQAFGCSIEFEE